MKFFLPNRLATAILSAWLLLAFDSRLHTVVSAGGFDYKDALRKSLLFLEAQRSGRLLPNNRVPWRGDSGIQDGQYAKLVDLVGGYYDAGDNVKYGMPMAFTISTLAWGALAYRSELEATGEFENTLAAIKWGTYYFLKAARRKNHMWVQVGDPVKDHECWSRPENMNTPRTLYQIGENIPGTEIAAETAAVLAASSILFRDRDPKYTRRLLNRAKMLFEFAKTHRGTYDGECPFYCSSGYQDELLWAATWLHIATKSITYYKFITEEAISNSVVEFNWDLKYAGAQILLSGLYFNGDHRLNRFKTQADNFVCAVLPDRPYKQIYISPGGMIHLRDGANTQYVTGTALLLSVYGDILSKNNQKVSCGSQTVQPSCLTEFAKQQMDYVLGKNPLGQSYMVGFGNKSSTQAHHRGASVPRMSPAVVTNCPMSFANWFNKNSPNPNELTGAIVGSPDRDDHFDDKRWDSSKLEPTTYINSLAIGVLARLAVHGS